jgi:hypothetical protein
MRTFTPSFAVSGAAGPSVVRLRRQGLDAFAVPEIIEAVLAEYEFDLTRGSLVTVKLNKTTCHMLPIGGR